MSRYAYDYSLSPARPTGWRGTLAGVTVVGTVMVVSAISGVLVTLQLFASPASTPRAAAASSVPPQVATATPAPPTPQPVASRVVALATRAANALVLRNHVEPPTTVAAVPTAPKVASPVVAPVVAPAVAPPEPAPVATVAQPAPVAAVAQPAPAPVAESDLTFAKGYALRRAIARGAAVRHGKVLVASQAQLGRAAVRAKPRVVARNNANADRRRADAYGMFQRFDRPDQFDFNHHQALAFGEQRPARRRNEAPPARSSGGFFGGLF